MVGSDDKETELLRGTCTTFVVPGTLNISVVLAIEDLKGFLSVGWPRMLYDAGAILCIVLRFSDIFFELFQGCRRS